MKATHRTPPLLASTAFAVMFGVALVRGLASFWEPDVWWHLRVGEHVLDTHKVYGTDPWSHFTDKPYAATQWLAEAAAAQTYRWAGLGGVLWLRAAAILAFTALVFAACRRTGGRLSAALITGMALVGASGGFNPRPQLLSFALFAVVAHAWMGTAHDMRPRWWLVAVFWVWGCSHGLWMFGVLLGVVTTAAMLPEMARSSGLRRRLAPLLALHAASVSALAVTPLGPRLLLTPFTVAGNAQDVADEWKSTPITNAFALMALALILLTVVSWLLRPGRRPAWQYAWLALGSVLVLAMWRLVPLGVVLVAPLASGAVQSLLSGPREAVSRTERRSLLAAVAGGLVVAALVCAGPQGTAAFTYPGGMHAIDASLGRAPAGSVVMVDFGVSGWLLWRHPDLIPSADLRMESYSHAYLHRYLDAAEAKPGWDVYLRDAHVRYALVERTSALSDALVREQGWRALATSPEFVLLAAPVTS